MEIGRMMDTKVQYIRSFSWVRIEIGGDSFYRLLAGWVFMKFL